MSEAFPASERTVKKIIKSKHQLKPEKVRAFDAEVRQNWKKLSSGELEISGRQFNRHLDI